MTVRLVDFAVMAQPKFGAWGLHYPFGMLWLGIASYHPPKQQKDVPLVYKKEEGSRWA